MNLLALWYRGRGRQPARNKKKNKKNNNDNV